MTEIERYNKEAIELYLQENEILCPEVLDLFHVFVSMSTDFMISMEDLLSEDDENPIFDKMDIHTSLNLVREFLGTIDKDYVKLFDKSLVDGTFDIFLPEDDLVERPDEPITTPVPEASIYIPVQNTIEDGAIIVHEFFHYTNDIEELVGVREIFTEMISIYFEQRYFNFLCDKGYNSINFDRAIYFRINNSFNSADNLCYTGSIFDIYNYGGKISHKNIKELDKYRGLLYNENTKNLISFYKDEAFEEGISEFRIDVSYLIGTLLALFSLKEPKLNDIKMNYINKNINNLDIKKILNILDTKMEEYPVWIEESIILLEKAIGEIYGEDYSNNWSYRSR